MQKTQKNRNQQYKILTALCCVMFFLVAQGCGSGKSDASDQIDLYLQLPEGESPESFWLGVHKKELSIKRSKEKPVTYAWDSPEQKILDLRIGDELHFSGKNARDEVVVAGEAQIGKEKIVSIPVRRVL